MTLDIGRRALFAALLSAGSVTMLDRAALAKRPTSFFKRRNLPIGLQLYSLGDDVAKDVDATLARVAAIGYRDIELPSLLGMTAPALKAAADRAGLKYSSLHLTAAPLFGGTGLSLADPADTVAEAAHGLGIRDIVMPIQLMPDNLRPAEGETFQAAIARGMAEAGADIWKRTAAVLNEKAAALKPHGIRLGYHNHNLEFAPIGTTNGWDILMRETDPGLISLELDIGWIAAAGLDPVAFLMKHKGRVRQIHVKDVRASTRPNFALSMDPTEIGSGKLDWARILPAAYKAGVRNFYVEQEPPFSMPRIDAVKRSFDFLTALKA